jgi:hypothetical protein
MKLKNQTALVTGASPEAVVVTGQGYNIDGGVLMS